MNFKLAKVIKVLWGLWLSPCLSCLQSSMEDKGVIAHPLALISKGVCVAEFSFDLLTHGLRSVFVGWYGNACVS